MNMQKVVDTLHEHGISHRQLPQYSVRINWLLDGASRPVIVFNAKENMVTKMPEFRRLDGKTKSLLMEVMTKCKLRNIH